MALAIALSGPLIAVLFWLSASIWLLAAVHMLAAIGAWRLWRTPGPGGRQLGWQAGSLSLCFPVVGSVCAWLLFGRAGEQNNDIIEAYRHYIDYDHQEPLFLRPIDARVRLLREVGVMPLRDQLIHGDITTKQVAASALADMDGDSGVKVLRQALTHEHDDTRLLASLALVSKEERLVRALTSAREACKSSQATGSDWFSLGSVARQYAESGLPAPKAAEGYWAECEMASGRALGQSGAHGVRSWLEVAASRAGRKNWMAALEAYESALALEPLSTEALMGRCEALFALNQLDRLADATRTFAVGSDLHEFAAYWGATHGS
jgi:tetratricopeptide (TPR) repeat protein